MTFLLASKSFVKLMNLMKVNYSYNLLLAKETHFMVANTMRILENTYPKCNLRKRGKLNQFYGKKHKIETIESNRKKNIEILTKLKGKKVNQYDLDGNLIGTHDGIRSAARSVNLKCYNEISRCCRGLKENYCGYIWKYA